jgi:pimeloyl-ACP methyl ester carboxylesterase
VTVFASESGPADAPSVVLLHGVGTSGWMWRRVAAILDADLHVVVPDLPGHGRSNRRRWISMADTVQAVAEVIAQLPGGRAHVVGLSLGGYVAARLAADLPAVVASAVVSGISVLPFPRPGLMRLAGHVMAPFMTSTPMLRANARALGVTPEDFDGYRAAAKAMAPGTFLRVGNELMDFRVPQGAGLSPCRLLAVAGEKEQQLILRSLPELAAGYRFGTARIAPGVGHAWNGEAPDLFAETIRAQVADADLPDQLLAAGGVGS